MNSSSPRSSNNYKVDGSILYLAVCQHLQTPKIQSTYGSTVALRLLPSFCKLRIRHGFTAISQCTTGEIHDGIPVQRLSYPTDK